MYVAAAATDAINGVILLPILVTVYAHLRRLAHRKVCGDGELST